MNNQNSNAYSQQCNNSQRTIHSGKAKTLIKEINTKEFIEPFLEEFIRLVGIGAGTVILKKIGVPGDVIKMILKKVCLS